MIPGAPRRVKPDETARAFCDARGPPEDTVQGLPPDATIRTIPLSHFTR
jgi:hypothetical protein